MTVNATGCGFDPTRGNESSSLSSATQRFGGNWRTECLNTSLPLTTLRSAVYSVKLIFFYYTIIRRNLRYGT